MDQIVFLILPLFYIFIPLYVINCIHSWLFKQKYKCISHFYFECTQILQATIEQFMLSSCKVTSEYDFPLKV